MTSFALRLKQLRTKKQLSQEELAKELGVSKSAIGMYERGKRTPPYESLEEIADYFNVDMDFLMGRTDYTTRIEKMDLNEAPDPDFEVVFDAW